MQKNKVSVVVITKNEEANLDWCLSSVHEWADEIIIVDDESTDKTVSIAQKYTDKVLQRKMDKEGRHRNWAYKHASNEWVFSMDADEAATPELLVEIDKTLENPEFPAYTIPRRNYLGDHWLKHGGQYPAAQVRLFMRDKFHYGEEDEVHPQAFLDGVNGHLTKDVIHKSFRDFAHFLAKVNGQTTLEARKWIRDGRKITFKKALWKSFDRFFRAYVRKKGYKDGMPGFMCAYFASVYQIMSYGKYWELKQAQEKQEES